MLTLHFSYENIQYPRIEMQKNLLNTDSYDGECIDNDGKRCIGCLARGGGCDQLSEDKCGRAARFGAKWCPGKL